MNRPNGQSAADSDTVRRRSRVLVVEDDPGMQRMVADYLDAHGIDTAVAANRKDMLVLLARDGFDLMVLDLRLGADDGLELLRELRGQSDLPIIIVTGHGTDEVDRVLGLELGADDYLTKPFSLRELLARIRVVLRRVETARNEPAVMAASGVSSFAGWALNRRARRLTDPEGNEVGLTKGEYALLVAFLDSPGRPLSREQLLQATRVHEDIYDRSIDVQILRLRRKLEVDPAAPTVILTERGFGYRFAVPVEHARPPVPVLRAATHS
jgi:two-component system, OmpR family, response regulator